MTAAKNKAVKTEEVHLENDVYEQKSEFFTSTKKFKMLEDVRNASNERIKMSVKENKAMNIYNQS